MPLRGNEDQIPRCGNEDEKPQRGNEMLLRNNEDEVLPCSIHVLLTLFSERYFIMPPLSYSACITKLQRYIIAHLTSCASRIVLSDGTASALLAIKRKFVF